MVAPREGGGAEIVEVKPGSVAELTMLHVGDVINTLDGKSIHTPMELAAELQNRAPGSQVRLGYMFRTAIAYYQKETVVILGGNH